MATHRYHSIFTPTETKERERNFDDYWEFSQRHSGEIYEDDKDLSKKREKLAYFQSHPIRSQKPLADPEAFYRNYVTLKDDPKGMDRKTLLLTCIYKFARHEWVGISGAWDAIPSMADSKSVTDRISRYHLAEEFCHVRFFHEMFKTFQLDRVQWVPLGPFMRKVYSVFPYVPEALMSPPAFITELMGIVFYHHVDSVLDEILYSEPEARDRVRELLHEIMVDELAHIGQRRNFIGKMGIRAARYMISPIFRMFYKDIPESRILFNINQMVRDGQNFDYDRVSTQLMERSWVPSYCKTDILASARA